MSNPVPPNLPPEEVPAAYAPSDSGSDDNSEADYEEDGDEPAFRNLPNVRGLWQQVIGGQPEPDGAFRASDNNFYQFVPGWAAPYEIEHLQQLRRPALLPEDGSPSTYAQYVCLWNFEPMTPSNMIQSV